MIRSVAETQSTNADMLILARTGVEEGLWLRAEQQTAGRGRHGRIWVSPKGNLYATTLVRLRATDRQPATLALVAAVTLADVAGLFLRDQDVNLELKWPNDLLVNGAKVSGILLERSQDAVVIGFGVNLADHPALVDRPTTSLSEHGTIVTPDTFLDTLADVFAQWLGRWRTEGLAPVRARWIQGAHPIGTALTARLSGGEAVDGLFDGLDGDGALLLRLASGQRRVIHAADIFLL